MSAVPFSSGVAPCAMTTSLSSGVRTVGTTRPGILALACGTPCRPLSAMAPATVTSVTTVARRTATCNVWTTDILSPFCSKGCGVDIEKELQDKLETSKEHEPHVHEI